MSSLRVVLDACVLIPAAPRDTMLRAASVGLFRLYWSDEILAEVRRNLVSERMTDEEGARRLVMAMREAFPDSLVQGYEGLIPLMTNHPKDRHVLAAAVTAGAQVIVTSNLRDFRPRSLAPHGIEAQSPDAFLTYLYHLAPDLLVEIVRRQATLLRKPPLGLSRVIDGIALAAPGFAALVKDACQGQGLPM